MVSVLMATISRDSARSAFSVVVGHEPTNDDLDGLMAYAQEADLTYPQLLAVLGARAEVVLRDLDTALELHLFALHHARVTMMATLLPAAKRIVDLGGANAPLYESGYPYDFTELTLVDLPPADRHTAFANRLQESKQTDHGAVNVLYTDMTDLSAISDASVDLVWSGQSIEHISRDDAHAVYREVRRVLRPEGAFCLDTPNALVTRIHSPDALIHPDHKIEYTPTQLTDDLAGAGFAITKSFGICEMPFTVAAGAIDYRDFLVGAGISQDLDRCYIQFHECRPSPEAIGATAASTRRSPMVAAAGRVRRLFR